MLKTIEPMKKILFTSFLTAALTATPLIGQATTLDIEENLDNIVYIECGSYQDDVWTPIVGGSGVVVSNNLVLTNAHVVADTETGYYHEECRGGVSGSAYLPPELTFHLDPLFGRYDDYFDYALMETSNDYGGLVNLNSAATFANADSMILNEYLYVLGYPGTGGNTITATEGNIAGFLGDNWIKSDVYIEHGSSGGGAFDELGNFFGLTTGAVSNGIGSLSYLQNINSIMEDMFGTDIVVRDFDTLYTRDNVVCVDNDCYNLADDEGDRPDIFGGIDEDAESAETGDALADEEQTVEVDDTPETTTTDDETPVVEEPVDLTPPENGRYQPEQFDASLQTRLKGSILLQVDEHGEAWYVNPNDSLRYYMANGSIAYQMMRSFSLGITDADLEKIPAVADTEEMSTATSICASNALANRLRGYILLQVQQHGEAWYIDPDTCRRIYMKDGDVAYEIMRFLSLGITNMDLEKLPSGEIE